MVRSAWCAAIVLAGLGPGACTFREPIRPEAEVRFSTRRPESLPARLPIALTRQDPFLFVNARVNGQDAGLFLLDTGSTLNIIGQGVAARLHLPSSGRGTVIGIGGEERFTYRRIQSLSVAGLDLEHRVLASLNLHRFTRPLGVPVNGVLGCRAFQSLPITIDYESATLTIHRPGSFRGPVDVPAVPLVSYAGLPSVEAEVGKAHRVWLVLDTGAHVHVTLPLSCARKWPDIVAVAATGPRRSIGVGGRVGGMHAWLSSLRIFGCDLSGVPVTFDASGPEEGGAEPVIGRVGNGLLKSFILTLAPQEGLVWAQPRDAKGAAPPAP